jgi:hypothetical protein
VQENCTAETAKWTLFQVKNIYDKLARKKFTELPMLAAALHIHREKQI